MSKVDARELRVMLQDRLDELLGQLFPGTRIGYPTFSPKNPTRNDAHPGSFVIWTRGEAKGGYRDYATGQSGDVIDLLALAHNREGDKAFAFDFARDFLGLAKLTGQALRAAKDRAKKSATLAAATQDAIAASRRRRALEIVLNATPAIAGTVVEHYLASREIALGLVPNREELRFMPELEHWASAEWKNESGQQRKVKPGASFPAMIAALHNNAGDVTAVHCTFLRRDGSGKADVERPKLMLGQVQGSAVWISRGPDNLTLAEAALNGTRCPLILTEGIEDALTLAVAVPEARVWAATSLGNLGNIAPPADAASIIVAADNDWGKPQAQDQLTRAIDELSRHGVPVTVMRAHEGKDFNDLMRGRAA